MTRPDGKPRRRVRGESLDRGDGLPWVRVHWFQRHPDGPITTPSGSLPSSIGPLRAGGTRGRIACQPALRSAAPVVRGGITYVLVFTEDAPSASCPDCRATRAYWERMVEVAAALGTPLSADDAIRALAAGVTLNDTPAEKR